VLLSLRTARLLVAIVAYFLAVHSIVAARIPVDQWVGQAAFDPLAVVCTPGGSVATDDMASHESSNSCQCATQRGMTVNNLLALPATDAPSIRAPRRTLNQRSFDQEADVVRRPDPVISGPRGPPA
jgi:hypothetical protein